MKLNKALYRLKKSLREWNITLDIYLCRDLKMTRLKTEHCIYVRFTEDRSQYLILAVYVDDLIIPGSIQATTDNFKSQSFRRFQCNNFGGLDSILNIKITRSMVGGLFLSQYLYIEDMLKRFAKSVGSITTKFNDSVTPMNHKSGFIKMVL